MKKLSFITMLTMFASLSSFAQKQSVPLPYNKERLDSIFGSFPKSNQPFVAPTPKGYVIPYNEFTIGSKSFEELNSGVAIISKTNKGIIYNMPLDNMAVLMPDMNTVENMPKKNDSKNINPENIPNPLYPGAEPKKKNK